MNTDDSGAITLKMSLFHPSALLYILLALICGAITVSGSEGEIQTPKYLIVNKEKRYNGVVDTQDYDSFQEVQDFVSSPHREDSERIRKKREAEVDEGGDFKVSVSHLNDSHQQVRIHWAGEGSPVIICLLRNAVQEIGSHSTMFISKDYGSTYQNVSNRFHIGNGTLAVISSLYNSDVFLSRFVFTDVLNKYIFVTKDYGETIVAHELTFTPSDVMFHPLDPEVLIIHDTDDKARKLMISEDFGFSWREIGDYVKSFFISKMTTPPTLYVHRELINIVVSSQDLFHPGMGSTEVIKSVLEFDVKDDFLFAVRNVSDSNDSLSLLISYQGGEFYPAVFPNTKKHRQYYIADVSEGQVMVCVAHEEYLSNLYVSSVPRSSSHPVKFSLSMERIVFFKPSSTWGNSWLSEVTDKEFADLHRVSGIRGVFIASQLLANVTATNGSALHHIGPQDSVSYISFDQGAQWKPLQPPQQDVYGITTDCKRKKGCSLHLGQSLSRYYPLTSISPMISKESAPGLILATGTIGTTLKGHKSLYLSVDAGQSWHQVLPGSFIYTIGDHGGILVAVKHFRAGGETNVLLYSINDGETWRVIKFSDEKYRIYGLLTEPGENTTIFTLFGSKPEKHQWILIKVDLGPVFKRNCTAVDYKKWSPSDGPQGRPCLLGRKQVYERRSSNATCYSGVNYDRPISTENCPCDRDDYECDFGFMVDKDSGKCVKESDDAVDPFAIPSSCVEGEYYNRTRGYRLIPGDTCEGGRDVEYKQSFTACPVKLKSEFLVVSARQEILRFDLVNPEAGMQPLPIPNLNMVIALDFDLTNNCIFWSDVNDKKIYRLCLDGLHHVETLVEKDILSVEGVAYDWISRALFFVDGEKKTLEVIRTDTASFGRMRKVLLDHTILDNPRGIALHPHLGLLFLTDWSESSPKVARAHLDGKNFTTLFGAGVVGWPNGITIDFQEQRIYFADAKLDFIASAKLNGEDLRKIITNSEKVSQPFAVGIYKSTLFWDDWRVNQVLETDKVFGLGISPIANFTRKGLVDLKVFGHWSQKGTNMCASQEDKCKYLCMGTPNNSYSCLCPDGLQPAVPGSEEQCVCPNGLPVDGQGACESLNNTCPPAFFRCNNNKCIPEAWVCNKDDDCGDGSDENSPKCGIKPCYPSYWQCRTGQCIALNFRCDHSPDCDDGSDEENCNYETCGNNSFTCANGKCIHKQWRCDLEDDCRDGSDELNCTKKPDSECKGMEFRCEDKRCIPASWRCDGYRDCPDNSDESSCVAFNCSAWQFACNSTNKCIYRNWLCDGEKDCADGSDEVNCTDSTTLYPPLPPITSSPSSTTENQCSELMFKCDNEHCIPFWWRCDLLDDCVDGSDEEGCPGHGVIGNQTTQTPETTTIKPTCSMNHFQCMTGHCIWQSWVCDGDDDCLKGEDEVNCSAGTECSLPTSFPCRRSGGCIPVSLRCNGRPDCPDWSDEEGCNINTTSPASCPSGYMACDGGVCLALFKACDGIHDCVDRSDEQGCAEREDKFYSVTEYKASSTNVSIRVDWKVNNNDSAPAGLEYLLSYTTKTAAGNPVQWTNTSWTLNTTYELHDLSPYTEYVVKVFIRNGTMVFAPIQSKKIRTRQGKPSPPQDVKLERDWDVVRVSWKPPASPNGPINAYQVFIDSPSSIILLSGDRNSIDFPSSKFSDNAFISVSVTNDEYMSDKSNRVQFHLSNLDQMLRVKVTNISKSSAFLSWRPVEGVDGYLVSRDQPENMYFYLMGNITTKTAKPSTQVTGLAPGLTYTFRVKSYKDKVYGPETEVRVITKGEKLPPVELLQATMTEEGTGVKLSWKKPLYNSQEVSWTYRVIYGKTANELRNGSHHTTTPDTALTIQGLDRCETYLIAVMIVEPFGAGPLMEKQIKTAADVRAAPRNLHARVQNMTMWMTWEHSCSNIDVTNHSYLVSVTETTQNVLTSYKLLSQKNLTQRHYVEVFWGGHYSVQVQMAIKDAIPSKPVTCSGPQIPAPYEMTYSYMNRSLFWRNSQDLPEEIASTNYTYVLRVSQSSNMTGASEYECKRPPLVVNDLERGVVYYAAVALQTTRGYFSLWSQPININEPIANELVISQNSAVAVGVSVFLVVVVLMVVVVVLAVRHRRLARSFLIFTNTHYDRFQGTTLITTDHSLDEDDDSPMIRGFSDDEPLVIA